MIHKPANIAIQKLLLVYKPENKEVDTKTDNSLLLIDCGGTVFHRLQELTEFF